MFSTQNVTPPSVPPSHPSLLANALTTQQEVKAVLKEVTASIQTFLHTLAHDAQDKQSAKTSSVPFVSTAESCTGGLLAQCFTQQAGSSTWFQGGVVVYHNRLKTAWLGVKETLLHTHGAVSEACSQAMAYGMYQHSQAAIILTTTGIASPNQQVSTKPEGTLYVSSLITPSPTHPRLEESLPLLLTKQYDLPLTASLKQSSTSSTASNPFPLPDTDDTTALRQLHQWLFVKQALLHLQEHLTPWVNPKP